MDKFVIEIALGNEAMQTPHDVAEVLDVLQTRMRDEHEWGRPQTLWDINGNPVGTARLVRKRR